MFDGIYHDRVRAISKLIIDSLGHTFFSGKSLLDLGCGHSDLSAVFFRLGSKVIVCDARNEHLKVAGKKYPGITTKLLDLDKSWAFKSTDIIIASDILCHLKNWQPFLANACNSTNYLILESAILDSDAVETTTMEASRAVYDGSFNGFASIPSAAAIEQVLSECGMTFTRYDSKRLNTHGRIYDWKVGNTKNSDGHFRRFWIAKKSTSGTNPVQQSVNNPKHSTGLLLAPPPFSPIPAYEPLPSVPLPTYPDNTLRSITPPPQQTPQPTVKPGARLRGGARAPVIETLRYTTRLFFPYIENNPKKLDMDLAFRRNIDNLLVDLVVVSFDTAPSFNDLVQKINQLANDSDISIICNPNVFFDRSVSAAQGILPREVYALGGRNDGLIAWVVKGKVNMDCDAVIGESGSDEKIIAAFMTAGYKINSPANVMAHKVGV